MTVEPLERTETVDAAIARVFKPIQQFVRGWMYGAEPAAFAKTLGLRSGTDFMIIGRAGVMGSCTAETATAALAFRTHESVERAWNTVPDGFTHFDISVKFAERAHQWGDSELVRFDADRLERLDSLGRRIADAAPSSLGPIFAGWRAMVEPESVHARVALTTHMLREMRCAAHIAAVHSVGINPLDAILASTNAPPRTGPGYAERMGFVGPFRDPEEVRAQRIEAEEITARMLRPYFAVLNDDELADFGEIVETTRNAIDM